MSFQQGLSGLSASSQNLDVIGNNVANANTYGAKQSRVNFADLYATSLSGGGNNGVGIGVSVASITQQFTQGNITTTNSPLDLAINGNGFFQVQASNGNTLFTRNGSFSENNNGFLVDNAGNKLLGYSADSTGNIVPGQPSPIQMPTSGINPQVTSAITLQANLDSSSAVTVPATGTIDFNNAATYNNATSQNVYDAKGQAVTLTYYFQKSATDTWNVYVTANGTTVATNASGNPAPITTITYPTNGGNPTSPAAPVPFSIPSVTLTNGGTSVAIPSVTFDVAQTTEYGSSFGVTNLTQNGYAPGQLTGVSVDSTGIILAKYSNGQSKAAGQLVLANFINPQGLIPQSDNNWSQSIASGAPILGTPSTGNFGVLQAGALESSNIDLTTELVNMISAQRAYQANAQTIKAEDQIMQTTVNLG